MDLATLLAFAIQQQASDLHLSAGLPPMIRVHGLLRRIQLPPLEDAEVRRLLGVIMSPDQQRVYDEALELDFSFEQPGLARFRVNAFHQSRGAAAVLRAIPSQVLSLQQLEAPPVLAELVLRPRGLVLVTGPTGSGKSTTLAAMIDHLNRQRQGHVLTIEDPIEFVHSSHNCLVSQREVGRDSHGFAAALRSALREDPDVILVGEMRDLETMRLALTAAETGHLVLGTLHTAGAAKTVDRVIDVFEAGEKEMVRTMLSESLLAVVSQTLLRRRDGQGRVAAHEIMLGTPAVRNLIREGKVAQMYSAIQTGQAQGMQTLDQSLARLLADGRISPREARMQARAPEQFPD